MSLRWGQEVHLEECLFHSRVGNETILPHVPNKSRVSVSAARPRHVDTKESLLCKSTSISVEARDKRGEME